MISSAIELQTSTPARDPDDRARGVTRGRRGEHLEGSLEIVSIEISEDTLKDGLARIQSLTDDNIKLVDDTLKKKETEILGD